jgi:hypothetical protein
VFRRYCDGEIAGDVVAAEDESIEGEPLLVPFMEGGKIVRSESMEQLRERTLASLGSLPDRLRPPEPSHGDYTVEISERLRSA